MFSSAFLAMALFGAGSGSVVDSLTDELQTKGVVEWIEQELFQEENVASVRINRFSGTCFATRDNNTVQLVGTALEQALQNESEGWTIKRTAEWAISAKMNIIYHEDSRIYELIIDFGIVDRFGHEKKKKSIGIKALSILSALSGVPVVEGRQVNNILYTVFNPDKPPTGVLSRTDDGDETVRYQTDDTPPKPFDYAIQILVKGENGEFRAIDIPMGDGDDVKGIYPVFSLRDGHVYQIRLINHDKEYEAVAEIYIDGVPLFTLSKVYSLGTMMLVPKAGTTDIPGWPIDGQKAAEFEVGKFHESVFYKFGGNPGRVGTITVVFHKAWKEGEAGPLGGGDSATIPGKLVGFKTKPESRIVGIVEVTYTIRYLAE